MSDLISVIIPIYNKENFIQQCVNSVISQIYSNVEIILVNDGSKDESASICKDIATSTPSVVLINQENRGVSAARNMGIKNATGEYVFFLDADDSIPSNALNDLILAIKEYDSDLAIGKFNESEEFPIGTFNDEEYLIKSLEDNPIAYSACRILYKRSFISDLTFPEGYASHEDSYFTFLCALKKPKVVTINTVVYHYTAVNNSASRSNLTVKKYNDICALLDKKEKSILENYPHLTALFYHLKVKIQMALLTNLALSSGNNFSKMEKETLERFKETKAYFQPDLPCSNAVFYNLLVKGGYTKYKIRMRFKSIIKQILKY